MWDLAVREDDIPRADSMVRRYRGVPPWSYSAVSAYARADTGALRGLLAVAASAENRQVQIAARLTATFLADFAAADSLARLDLSWRTRPAIRQDTRLLIAWLALARGRWADAAAGFDRAESEGAPGVLVHRALGATLPFLDVPRQDLLALRDDLARWAPATIGGGDAGLTATLQPALRLYLLGLLSSKLDDASEAARRAAELDSWPGSLEARAIAAGLAGTVRADVAARSGNYASVLGILDRVVGGIPLELVSVPRYQTAREFTMEHARWLRAAALKALKRDREAMQWLQNGFQGAPNEIAYQAAVDLERAELYERMGQGDRAADLYERGARLWETGDPAQRAKAERARGRATAILRSARRHE